MGFAIDLLALTMIGFSIVACALLALMRVTAYRDFDPSPAAIASAFACMATFIALQAAHAAALAWNVDVFQARWYVALLYLSAAALYVFCSAALQPPGALSWRHALSAAPVVLAFVLPPRVAVPLSFLFGMAYSGWLLGLLRRLRDQRRHYVFEWGVFVSYAAVAVLIFALGAIVPWFSPRGFVWGYAIAIGLNLVIALYALLRFPELPVRVQESVNTAYAVSTLSRVDREQALDRLRRVMEEERAYIDDGLNLATTAELAGLAPHQLSELINTHYGMSFPRWLRGYRVEAAKAMLLAEPKASVLSVGLSVGFGTQSNFYTAFREITGQVPGQYRKARSAAPDG